MEFALLLAGAILGAVSSWYIQHVYFAKASSEQEVLFKKLSIEVRNAILEDQRQNLSIVELNEVIMAKALAGQQRRAFAYVMCPKCGSENLEKSAIVWTVYDPDGTKKQPGHLVKCKNCNWVEGDHEEHETKSTEPQRDEA